MEAEFWFKPKAFGYGATPVTWEGWVVVAAFVAFVAVITVLLMVRSQKGFTAWASWTVAIVIATSALTLASWSKTDGPWEWRWGSIENSGKAS